MLINLKYEHFTSGLFMRSSHALSSLYTAGVLHVVSFLRFHFSSKDNFKMQRFIFYVVLFVL